MAEILNVSRRGFLLASASVGGGLVLACLSPAGLARAVPRPADVGSWIRIGVDGRVRIVVEKSEMGQGVHTALPMLVAEELEVDWRNVAVETRVFEGRSRDVITSGSSSVHSGWQPLRRAGAAAREMLVAAAADGWGVPVSECRASRGLVRHVPSGRTEPYGSLALAASRLAVPENVRLKDPADWTLIGRPLPRLDVPGKVDGSARFGIDVELPGMLHAAIRMSPQFGGTLSECDEPAALRVDGVTAVVRLPGAVAVVARDYWHASRGLEALAPTFEGGNREFDSDRHAERLREALDRPGVVAREAGDALPLLANAERLVEADYEVPHLAHATMEPMNCTARVVGRRCDLWAPTQAPSALRADVADALGVSLEDVRVHMTQMGGGFGRRTYSDFGVQAALVSRSVGQPVKLIWSREEDLRHDRYRPAYAARLRAAVDAAGKPVAWTQLVAGNAYEARGSPSWLREAVAWLQRTFGPDVLQEGLPDALRARAPYWIRAGADWAAVQGGGPGAYAVANHRLEHVFVPSDVPPGWWRSVGHSQNAFFVESFVDELAHAAGRDPVGYRHDLLVGHARGQRALARAAEAAGWGEALPAGRGRGVAFHSSHGSIVCQVAEVSAPSPDEIRVHRVTCVVDCGVAVNPDTVRAQMEGGIVFGLSAALYGRVDFRGGVAEPRNFDGYPLLRLAEAPEIEVHVLDGGDELGGVGEPGTALIAPAVANALFAATGRRARALPLHGEPPGR